MGLARYHAKRRFAKTPEPRGREGKTRARAGRRRSGGIFVIQKHDATRLHYDVRLEMGGVLVSWACPKGPSLDPVDKRLAVHVEDHPLEYADFEGHIPEGEYGGGPVIVWDRGRWSPEPGEDPEAGYRRGSLAFRLEGEKLHGSWRLVRMKGRGDGQGRNWLLFKKDDDAARRGREAAVTQRRPESVVSGRDVSEIPSNGDGDEEAPPPSPSSRAKPAKAGVPLSNPDRVLWSEQGVTKRDLAAYYEAVADRMLPHVAGRPLMLLRCPQGQGRPCFVQKHVPHGHDDLPEGLVEAKVREKDGVRRYVTIARGAKGVAGLVSLVQLGALEIHVWGARADSIERPDDVVFDLDPAPDVPFSRVVEAAVETRDRLDDLGLRSFVKTTGGKGLHVEVPIARVHDWDDVKAFARAFAESMATEAPDRYLSKASKAARAGRIFVDWLRNGRGATAVAPYSTRAMPGAPVAVPLAWEEVVPRLDPLRFTVKTVPRRRETLARDPWQDVPGLAQRLASAAKRLGARNG